MDEDITHMMRSITAELNAQRAMIDYIMKHLWSQIPRAQRLKIATRILDSSEESNHLRGIAAGDELMAANLAEIVEKTQTSIDQFVGRALKTIADVEDEASQRHKEGG